MKKWISQCLSNTAIVAKVMILLAIPTALLLFHVWNQYRITELGYQLAAVTTEHRALLEENKKLVVEARLQGHSERVSQVARYEFGLQEAHPDQFITVNLEEQLAHREEHAQLEELADSSTSPLTVATPE